MNGPYHQQPQYGQGYGQGVGHAGGPNVSQFSGQPQAAGQPAGQSAGGQYGGQAAPQAATKESQQVQKSSSGRGEKQQQRQDREVSQATSVQQSSEGSQSRHGSGNQTYHHHRNRDRGNSRSSSSSSAGVYNIKGVEGGAASGSSHHQYSTEGSYGHGGAQDGSYAGPNPCGAQSNPCGGERRPPRHQKQVIRLPDQAQGPTRQVRRRLPTPEPDTIEKIYVQRVAGEIVEEITEIPTTPPPIVKERNVCEPAGPPKVIKRCIRVPPRGGNNCQQSGNAAAAANVSQSSNLMSAGSYGSVQQASGSFQQFAGNSPTTVSGGFSNSPVGAVGGTNFGSGFGGAAQSFSPVANNFSAPSPAFGSHGASFQQQAPSFQQQAPSYHQQAPSFNSGLQQQAASYAGAFQQQHQQQPNSLFSRGFSFVTQGNIAPPAGLHQATCFYV